MLETFSTILKNVLTALYQPFWFAVLLSVLAMFLYLFATDKEASGNGLKQSFLTWLHYFKSSKQFRRL